MALVDHQCAAKECSQKCYAEDCSGDVKRHPGGENCQHVCEPECLMGCRNSSNAALRLQFERCLESKEPDCVEKCLARGAHSAAGCGNMCQVKARADCTTNVNRKCLGMCGRHVCTPQGRCDCPFFLRGNSMCTAYSWLHDVAPRHVNFCFQSIFDEKFHTSKFGDTNTPSIASSILYHGIRSSEATLEANRAHTGYYRHREHRLRPTETPFPDLPDLADFSTCAIVGSSGTLKGSRLGGEIDNHTAVIRFNDAPTSGYEADVGSKTTLRLQNNMYCGFCEKPDEILFPYTITTLEKFCVQRENRPECRVYKSSNELRNFVSRFYEPLIDRFAKNLTWYKGNLIEELGGGAVTNDDDSEYVDRTATVGHAAASRWHAYIPRGSTASAAKWGTAKEAEEGDPGEEHHDVGAHHRLRHKMRFLGEREVATQMVNGTRVYLKDISAGLTGIILAMHMCYKVDVYGFSQSGSYYYPKVKRTDRPWETIHFWELEHVCQDAYQNYLGRVQFHH
eukprot:CAMPEP_0177615582 /NCGR_PEP_ID=MMETSP0419_2-20121207/23543_1 /TAXON_ID=582737 /ORGANISM="Tetraselmis sp., Strain GSL018" /LENGTH=507 /DNA_ID=CAMNT_0019113271 /DNA_START=428 /DNA_END=1951 /DNA_ORIENTATION=-